MAYRSPDAARKDLADRATEANTATADAIITIVMATVAGEAFINELPEHIEAGRPPHLPRAQWAATPEMEECANALSGAVRDSLLDKYEIAALALGKKFDKGRAPFQDFTHLVGLRNGLVHLKPAWSSQNDERVRRIVRHLEQRRLTAPFAAGAHWSWFDKLMHPAIATWACDTVRNMELAVLALCPDVPNDPLQHLKRSLRDGRKFSP
jgi:hypothetical protein